MGSSMELNLKLSQKLLLTEEMRLSIDFLIMNPIEIVEFINKEIEANPLIEVNDSFNEFSGSVDSKFNDYLEERSTSKVNIKEHLLEQLRFSNINREDVKVALFIIESLDNRGYLTEDISCISSITEASKERVIRILDIIQGLEPAGIAARNLEECLELQLKRKGIMDEIFYNIINNYLHLLKDGSAKTLCNKLFIKEGKVNDYIEKIRSLNPIPTAGFHDGEEVGIIIPEAYIKQIDNDFEIQMNKEFYPGIKISKNYKMILEDKYSTKEDIKYVKEKIDRAKILMKSVEKRGATIKSIVEYIVLNQKEYFKSGDGFLNAMKMKSLAEKLDVHSSTISRAVRGKYIMIDNKLVSIRTLFTIPINKGNGNVLSNSKNYIKFTIKSIIDKEDKHHPINDEDISESLKLRDMNISRRTVAKYRSELKIDNSNKRRVNSPLP